MLGKSKMQLPAPVEITTGVSLDAKFFATAAQIIRGQPCSPEESEDISGLSVLDVLFWLDQMAHHRNLGLDHLHCTLKREQICQQLP